MTGKVAFDDNGDRINAEYNIVNIQEQAKQVSVGQYLYSNVSTKLITSSKCNVMTLYLVWMYIQTQVKHSNSWSCIF